MGANLSRTDRYSGRTRTRTARQLAELPDQFTLSVWAAAALVTPALAVVLALRNRREVHWWIGAGIAALGVLAAIATGHPLWIVAAPVAGELMVLARLMSGQWPSWTGTALLAWALAAAAVGPAATSILMWHRRRYRPTFEQPVEITDEALDRAVAEAQWRPLDPDELLIGPAVNDLSDVTLTRSDVSRHAMFVGESGTGKTVLFVQFCDWFLSKQARP